MYYLSHSDFLALSPAMRAMADAAFTYKLEYLEGRLEGLQKLDEARKSATYGSFSYSLGNINMTSAQSRV